MKSNMLSSVAVVLVVVAALGGVTRAQPIEREPRQFVFQPGSPSVRLYPVHFENYLKSSSGRVHMTTGQGFMLNMLPSAVEKPERTANEAPTPEEGTTMRPSTTTTATTSTTTSAVSTSTTTTSEHTMAHMTTMKPMVMVMETTLRPEARSEVEDETAEGSLPEARTESPNPEVLPETVTEEEMAAREGEEANEVTELAPTMMKEGMEEETEMETATELNNETPETVMEGAVETPANTEVPAAAATENEEAPATEMVPEEEMATETPFTVDLRRSV